MRWLLALLVAVPLVAGCASSHSSAIRPPRPHLFPSPEGRYSVRAVEAAFAAHGLRLHQAASQLVPGLVSLRGSGVSAVVAPQRGDTPILLYTRTRHGPIPLVKRFGNVIVTFRHADALTVQEALQALR